MFYNNQCAKCLTYFLTNCNAVYLVLETSIYDNCEWLLLPCGVLNLPYTFQLPPIILLCVFVVKMPNLLYFVVLLFTNAQPN